MPTDSQLLQRFQEYVKKTSDTDYGQKSADESEEYATRLSKTLHSLQNQVKQHEAALEKIRATVHGPSIDVPSLDPCQHLHQLQTITAAYKSLTASEPPLPSPDSPLPALLALRRSLNTVDQSKNAIIETEDKLSETRKRLRQEASDLRDAQLLTQALEGRIKTLGLEEEEQLRKSTKELAHDRIEEQQQRKHMYMMDLRNLIKAFNKFVDDHLAVILAAEDLGGPVVGDLVKVNEGMLKAGFDKQGKTRKIDSTDIRMDEKRQMRNNEIWGWRDEYGDEDERINVISEKEAALASFRSLIEDLLNAAAGVDKSDAYINIPRESAAVRFLVRANVAQFHPEDARKLRLVDFCQAWDN